MYQIRTSWASQKTSKMVESDFPRGFFELEVEILIRDPHVYSKRAQNRAFWIYFFFVRNPYICKFWDLIFEENGNNNKESPKGSDLGTLGILMRITCQNLIVGCLVNFPT